ncbi:MAG TPA: pyruvate dehydrogenase (acetyl-transferring) E1 component subunit alpha [Nitrososphaerales archaeon]|nr:pyruvate dehydrogenase (acetyl-transferring) E1 component subunit alpha [Nitrososphaerales archaeon]
MNQASQEGVLQVISLEGNIEQTKTPGLGKAELLRMYEVMVMTRTLDVKGLNLQRQGRIGFYVPCAGQEAAQIGSAFVLKEEDWTFPTYRDQGVALSRGVSMRKIIAHLMGNSSDPMLGKQMPNHWGYKEANLMSVASPISAHLPVAVGVAVGMKLRKKSSIVSAYHGDGGTSEGDFHAAYNFAGVNRAPIIFICENNGWAISLPVGMQTASQTLAIKADAYGFPGVRVDGNDVLAVYQASRDAAERARRGEGPTMIECLTYRMGPHSTSDDPNRYRTKEEIELWKKRDPIERFRFYLEKTGLWNQDYESGVRKRCEDEISLAISEEEKVPRAGLDTMFEGVYAEIPWNLKEQRKEEEQFSGESD